MTDKQPIFLRPKSLKSSAQPYNPTINIIDDPNIPYNHVRNTSSQGLYETDNGHVRRLSGQLNTNHIRSGSNQLTISPLASPTYNQLQSSNNTPDPNNGEKYKRKLPTYLPPSPMGIKPRPPNMPFKSEYENMVVPLNPNLLSPSPGGGRTRSTSQISMNSPLKFNDPHENRRSESDFGSFSNSSPNIKQVAPNLSSTLTEKQKNELLFSPNGRPSVSATMPEHFRKLAGDAIQQSPIQQSPEVVVSPSVPVAAIVYPVFTPQQLEGVKLYDDGKLEFPNGQILLVSSETGLITSLDTTQIYGILPSMN